MNMTEEKEGQGGCLKHHLGHHRKQYSQPSELEIPSGSESATLSALSVTITRSSIRYR